MYTAYLTTRTKQTGSRIIRATINYAVKSNLSLRFPMAESNERFIGHPLKERKYKSKAPL